MINSKNKISTINRKFDKIKYKEETGKTDRYIKNRALRKMLSNKLAVLGLFFVLIVIFRYLKSNALFFFTNELSVLL